MTIEQRALGWTGADVSRIILGCGNFGGIGSAPEFFGQGESEEEAHALLDAAWDLGITTFDTADAYGGGRSESYIGSWLAKKGAAVRDQVVVTTKLFHSVEGDPTDSGLSPKRVYNCLEASLSRLGLDHVPLYMTHQPDPATPIDETLRALDEQVERGLISAYGACNISLRELLAAAEASAVGHVRRLGWVQNEYNLFSQGDGDGGGTMPFCSQNGLGYTPFGPLAGGWLAGRYTAPGQYPSGSRMTLRPEPYKRFEHPATFAAIAELADLAGGYGVDVPTLAFAWLFSDPDVTAVIVGPRRPEHLEPAVRALELGLELDPPGDYRIEMLAVDLIVALSWDQ